MRPRPALRVQRPRGRATWCAAVVAAVLNALAPVLAYAIGQPLHELAIGRPGGGPRAVLVVEPAQVHAAHHGVDAAHAHGVGSQAEAAHHHGSEERTTPHCPYCLDFAAAAALGTTVRLVAAAQPGHAPLPLLAPAHVSARPSLRLAAPRGPPRAA